MKVAIIGSTGFVGGATEYSLHVRGVETVGYHVEKGSATKDQVNECDIAIVCVPTPMSDDGSCDLSIVEEVIGWLKTKLIVIKSTVPIGTTKRLADKTGKSIVHNPEFLREATAIGDAMNPNFVLVGSPHNTIYDLMVELLDQVYPSTKTVWTSSDYSEATKYAVNSFLAYKVGFFNELHHIAEAIGLDGKEITELMLNDPRIGESHTEVTEEGGFGGHCFPKDLNALIQTSIAAGYEPLLLEELWNSNRMNRKEFSGEEFNFYE